jgi:hypothetical protein
MGVPEAMLETASPICPLHPARNAIESTSETSQHVVPTLDLHNNGRASGTLI